MGILPLGTYSELLASARTATGEHGAAILGLHAAPEAVSLRAVAIVRLKSTFGHFSSSI
jgi:hypothetical protein